MLKEFKDFIAKGNVMDMAVGIIIGAAFTAIVTDLVGDLIQPIVGLFLGGTDLSNLFIVLKGGDFPTLAAAKEGGASVLAYGHFLMAIINFIIIAFVVFMLVKAVNKTRKPEEAEEAGPSELDVLLQIRDSLKK